MILYEHTTCLEENCEGLIVLVSIRVKLGIWKGKVPFEFDLCVVELICELMHCCFNIVL